MLEILSHVAFDSYDNEILSFAQDEVAEWLRRWTANPLGSARVGSNPILVDDFESRAQANFRLLKVELC